MQLCDLNSFVHIFLPINKHGLAFTLFFGVFFPSYQVAKQRYYHNGSHFKMTAPKSGAF
jgi:hypothetical protein